MKSAHKLAIGESKKSKSIRLLRIRPQKYGTWKAFLVERKIAGWWFPKKIIKLPYPQKEQ